MEIKNYESIVESLYDSAINPETWKNTIKNISQALRSQAAGVFLQAATQQYGGGILHGYDQSYVSLYQQRFAEENPWFVIPGLMDCGKISTDDSLIHVLGDRYVFLNSSYYQEWFRPQDYRHTMGINLIDNQGERLNFTLLRSAVDGHYLNHEIESFRAISRHLTKAIEINSRLHQVFTENTTNEMVLNMIQAGVIYLRKPGRIEFMNNYARKIIDTNQGLFEKNSLLHADDYTSNGRLSFALSEAYKQRKSSVTTIHRPGKSDLSVTILPTSDSRSFLGTESNFVVLFIADPDDREFAINSYLRERWKLSPLEAKFAEALLHGASVNEISEKLGLTQHTGRWYSKHIMQKLDVSRQNELILKLMRDLNIFAKVEY